MTVYIGNIPYTAGEEDIQGIFSEFGPVSSIKIITDKATGKSKGFGFVALEEEDSEDKAIEELDGKEFNGRNLRVLKAHNKTPMKK